MYPKNKPLPPEAASRAANLSSKKGMERSGSDIVMGTGTTSSKDTSVLRGFGREDGGDAVPPQPPQQQGRPSAWASRPPMTSTPPPSYVYKMREAPGGDSGYSDGAYDAGCESGMYLQNGKVGHQNGMHMYMAPDIPPPPPYEETALQSNEFAEGRPYDFLCGASTSSAPPPPPQRLRTSKTTFVEEAFYDGHPPHGMPASVMSPPPFAAPWPPESRPPPRHRQSSTLAQPHTSGAKLKSGSGGKSRKNGAQSAHGREKETNPQSAKEERLSERKNERGVQKDKGKKLLQAGQHGAQGEISTPPKLEGAEQQQKQKKQQEEGDMSSALEVNVEHILQQHHHDVNFLMQLVVALLERISVIKMTSCGTEDRSDSGPVKNSSCYSLDDDEPETPRLKEQLCELQDVLHGMETDNAAAERHRSRLLGSVLSLPQRLPLSAAASMNFEKLAAALSHVRPVPGKDTLLARGMKTEVKALMKALDFEMVRPITLDLVASRSPAHSSSSSSSSINPDDLTEEGAAEAHGCTVLENEKSD